MTTAAVIRKIAMDDEQYEGVIRRLNGLEKKYDKIETQIDEVYETIKVNHEAISEIHEILSDLKGFGATLRRISVGVGIAFKYVVIPILTIAAFMYLLVNNGDWPEWYKVVRGMNE